MALILPFIECHINTVKSSNVSLEFLVNTIKKLLFSVRISCKYYDKSFNLPVKNRKSSNFAFLRISCEYYKKALILPF